MIEGERVYRFAPSPTGKLHVGGARVAVFNWLLAKKNNGRFLLRIEDTDLKRSKDVYIDQILDSMRWLGLDWDDEPVFQSRRTDVYIETIRSLVAAKKVYRCFCTKEVLEKKRETSTSDNRIYDRTCLKLNDEEIKERIDKGTRHCVRFRIPDGYISFKDTLRKKISVDSRTIEDFIIQRADGSPTYNLTVVVDDNRMGVTDIIRGDDHLSNTPKQILLYEALGYPLPGFTHLPLILGEDKTPLSKRHGSTAVDAYREKGILPGALFNYLSLLGWTPPGGKEYMKKNEIITTFDRSRFNKSASVFDETRLIWLNSKHIRETSEEILLNKISEIKSPSLEKNKMLEGIKLIKSRMKLLTDFYTQGDYIFSDNFKYTDEAGEKLIPSGTKEILENVSKKISGIKPYDKETIEKTIRAFSEETGVESRDIIHPLRAALTGKTVSPGLFELMEYLGREKCIDRIKKSL